MVTALLGYNIKTPVRRTDLQTRLVTHEVLAGVTDTISFPEEDGGICVSMQIENQSGAASATYQVNGITTPIKILGANAFRDINNIPIVSVRVVAGAGGSVMISAEIAEFKDVLQ